MNPQLENEWHSFSDGVSELLREHRGEFVLWRNAKAIAYFDTYDDAYEAGLDRFGMDAVFLIAEVTDAVPSPPIAWQGWP